MSDKKEEQEEQQELPKTTMIELRQKNSRSINRSDSDYSCILNKPLTLDKGDVLQLSSAFIDTADANSGLIILDPDEPGGDTSTIAMDFGYYILNTPSSNELELNGVAAIQSKTFFDNTGIVGTLNENTDGEIYVACHRHETGAIATACEEIRINFKPKPFSIPNKAPDFFMCYFQYKQKDSLGNLKTITAPFGVDAKSTFSNQTVVNACWEGHSFILNAETMKVLSDFGKTEAGKKSIYNLIQFPFSLDTSGGNTVTLLVGDYHNYQTPRFGGPYGTAIIYDNITPNIQQIAGGDETRTLVKKTISFTTRAGQYSAGEITALISEKFTSPTAMGPIGTEDYEVVNNPLFTNVAELRADLTANAGSNIVFTRASDGLKEFEWVTGAGGANTAENFNIGTSQFGFNFIDDENKCQLVSIHSSLFDISGASGTLGQPQIRAFKTEAGGGKKFYANKYSGIFIQHLSPPKLWFDQLKLSNDIICVPKQEFKPMRGTNAEMPIFNDSNAIPNGLLDGRNMTCDEAGIDMATDKVHIIDGTPKYTSAYDIPIEFPTFPAFKSELVNLTIPILATGVISNGAGYGAEENGYYQIEVNMGIQNDIQGKDTLNSRIQAIVSRYYQSGSFTSAYNEGSIEYVHDGPPIELSKFDVRILNPDGTPATDIQGNNTIFLKILKNNLN